MLKLDRQAFGGLGAHVNIDVQSIVGDWGGTESEDSVKHGMYFERIASGVGNEHTYVTQVRSNIFRFSSVSDGASVDSGFSFDDKDGMRVLKGGIWVGSEYAGIEELGTISALAGSAEDPGIGFGKQSIAGTRVFTAGLFSNKNLEFGGFTYNAALGVALNSRTAFVFSASPLDAVTELDCPFVFHQDFNVTEGTMNTYIGPADGDSTASEVYPGVVSFGYRSYTDGWIPFLDIDYDFHDGIVAHKDIVARGRVYGRVTTRTADEQSPAFAFDPFSNGDYNGSGGKC
jgi:hypothetical protein